MTHEACTSQPEANAANDAAPSDDAHAPEPALDRGLEELSFVPVYPDGAEAPAQVLFAFEMPDSHKTCLVYAMTPQGEAIAEGADMEVMAGFCYPDELEDLAKGSVERLHMSRLETQEEVNAVEVVLAAISHHEE